jgi:hypothetical protein
MQREALIAAQAALYCLSEYEAGPQKHQTNQEIQK